MHLQLLSEQSGRSCSTDKKIALISADYEFIDYSTAKFSETGDGYNYSAKNQAIRNSSATGKQFPSWCRSKIEQPLPAAVDTVITEVHGKVMISMMILIIILFALGIGFREQNIICRFWIYKIDKSMQIMFFMTADLEDTYVQYEYQQKYIHCYFRLQIWLLDTLFDFLERGCPDSGSLFLLQDIILSLPAPY